MVFPRVQWRFAAIAMLLLEPAISRAATPQNGPPKGAVCVAEEGGGRAVDPLELVRWAIRTSEIRDQAIDANGDGDTLLAEKQLALTDPGYCGHPARGCSERDATAQRQIHARLAAFVREQDGNYQFERIRRPDQTERNEAPHLAEDLEQASSSFHVGETLAVPAVYVRVVCLEEPQRDVAQLESRTAEDGSPSKLPIRSGFRLTGSLDDLGKDRSTLGAVTPAQFSISGDLKKNQTTYLVNLFAGYQVELGQRKRNYFSAIPFFQFERRFNRREIEIDKIGGGGKFLATTVSENLGGNELAVSPYYLTDTKGDRQILTVQLRETPSLPERYGIPIGYAIEAGELLWQFGIDGLIEAGHVFRARNTEGPLAVGNFIRTGPRWSLNLQGTDGTLLDRLALNLAYKYLYGLTGPLDHFHRFDANLSYLLPGSESYKLGLSYTVGRVDDTLQEQQYWSTVLGVRF
ncbi:MAG: hypothetical protein AAF637_19240 [Pseudomonadota bacterium]